MGVGEALGIFEAPGVADDFADGDANGDRAIVAVGDVVFCGDDVGF